MSYAQWVCDCQCECRVTSDDDEKWIHHEFHGEKYDYCPYCADCCHPVREAEERWEREYSPAALERKRLMREQWEAERRRANEEREAAFQKYREEHGEHMWPSSYEVSREILTEEEKRTLDDWWGALQANKGGDWGDVPAGT